MPTRSITERLDRAMARFARALTGVAPLIDGDVCMVVKENGLYVGENSPAEKRFARRCAASWPAAQRARALQETAKGFPLGDPGLRYAPDTNLRVTADPKRHGHTISFDRYGPEPTIRSRFLMLSPTGLLIPVKRWTIITCLEFHLSAHQEARLNALLPQPDALWRAIFADGRLPLRRLPAPPSSWGEPPPGLHAFTMGEGTPDRRVIFQAAHATPWARG